MNQEEKIDMILAKVGKIERGLYGDADNKVPGLMQSHFELEKKVSGLMRLRYWVTGLFVGLQFAWVFFLEKVKRYV